MSDFTTRTYDERPTHVRYHILAAATAASFIMYLHRSFIAEILKYPEVRTELNLDATQIAYTYSAFFFSYALCQVPMGWVADAFGRRMAFATYVITWSIFTALGGFATGFAMMFVVRLMLGIAQAGAYPTAGGLVSKWVPINERGRASGLIAAGGRFGGVIFAVLTTFLLKKLGMPWQTVMFLYGGIGVLIGVWYWIVARNDPREHPWCNAAEIERIEHGRPPEKVDTAPVRAPVVEMLTSRVMWCMAVAQIGTNIGWTVVITTLPTYLKEATSVDDKVGAWLVATVWIAGFLGTMLGGPLVDYTTHRYGLRWGRMGPTIVTRFAAAACYIAALVTSDPYIVTAAFAAATFFSDLGLPGIWAFAQDVGGRSVGAVLGWGNMFGNLGAAAATPLYLWADQLYRGVDGLQSNHDGTVIAAMAGFVISGIAAFGINAAKPIGAKTTETRAA
jgi:ACS family glucarate transporter-like MFS transporter